MKNAISVLACLCAMSCGAALTADSSTKASNLIENEPIEGYDLEAVPCSEQDPCVIVTTGCPAESGGRSYALPASREAEFTALTADPVFCTHEYESKTLSAIGAVCRDRVPARAS